MTRRTRLQRLEHTIEPTDDLIDRIEIWTFDRETGERCLREVYRWNYETGKFDHEKIPAPAAEEIDS